MCPARRPRSIRLATRSAKRSRSESIPGAGLRTPLPRPPLREFRTRNRPMNRLLTLLAGMTMIAAASASSALPSKATQEPASTGWVAQQAPGFYRMRLGDFRITVLSDGTAPRDLPKIMSNPGEVRAAFGAAHQALPVELSINCYLIDTGAKRILVDTGAGELFGATSGKLVANLRAAGYRPED